MLPKAEGLGNDNRKTMIKVKQPVKYCFLKNGTALPSPFPAPCSVSQLFTKSLGRYLVEFSSLSLLFYRDVRLQELP